LIVGSPLYSFFPLLLQISWASPPPSTSQGGPLAGRACYKLPPGAVSSLSNRQSFGPRLWVPGYWRCFFFWNSAPCGGVSLVFPRLPKTPVRSGFPSASRFAVINPWCTCALLKNRLRFSWHPLCFCPLESFPLGFFLLLLNS